MCVSKYYLILFIFFEIEERIGFGGFEFVFIGKVVFVGGFV